MFPPRKAALVLLALALAGCGSSGGAGTAGASSTPNAADQAVKFAQCMRQHGVNMPDPTPGQRGVFIRSNNGDQAKLQAAMQACNKYSPKLGGNPNDPAERDRQLKLAQCLRRNGVDVPDPQPGQGLRITADKADNAKVQKAMETCRKEVPPPSPSPTTGR